MFTVIIAEQEHIDKVKEYELFLKPFLAAGNVVFCPWNLEEERLADMVPTLADLVGRRKDWRAVIVCDESGLEKQNPFDLVTHLPGKYTGPIRGNTQESLQSEELSENADLEHDLNYIYAEEYKEFLQAEHEKKLLAYEEAANNPLTRLVTFFCDTPTVTKREDSPLANGDPDYTRYIAEHERKCALRQRILSDELTETSQPTEVICVAKRTYVSAENEFNTVWSSHTELEYSHFYDRNMYFDKMRYLIFDILPKTQREYMFDYVRFLYATILLASNDIPKGCLANQRVYRLECKNDETALCELLQTYEVKLNLTKELLNQEIQQLMSKKPRVLADREAEQIFCVTINQHPIYSEGYSEEGLYAKTLQVGLANGCRHDEAILWDDTYRHSQKELANLLKQSRRALRRTTKSAREEQNFRFDRVELLNEYQLEDIQDHIDRNELEMLRTETVDLYNEEAFSEKMEEANKRVHERIKDRMYKRTTIGLGLVTCLLFVLGFFTIFFKNYQSNIFNFATSLIIVGIAFGAFALIAIVTLFFLRHSVVAEMKDFNNTMHSISNEVHASAASYSKYLSHMCNVRRGYDVLRAASEYHNPDHDRVVLYKKHISDIEQAREEAKEIFGQYMVNTSQADVDDLFPYDFNFTMPTQFQYPLPYSEGTARKITFIQAGVYATVPVEFVKEVTVRREELYE